MKNQNCIDTIAPLPAPAGFRLPPWLVSAFSLVGRCIERSRQRRQLAQLSDHALQDIGLTRADVRMEIEKPFWLP